MEKLMDFILKKVGKDTNIHFIIFGEYTVKKDNGIQTPYFSNIKVNFSLLKQ